MTANLVWGCASVPAWRGYRAALGNPAGAQEQLLFTYLRENAETWAGRTHRFATIRSIEDYQERVPITTYDDLEPLIQRVAAGQTAVLTDAPAMRLVPSSGSASATKLIPYTRTLQSEFNRAIGAWIVDLFSQNPKLMSGRSYWSISPAASVPTRI